LAAELPEQQFNTWIRPLPAAEVAENGDAGTVVTVRVPNRFKLDWIRNQYAGRIESVLSEIAGKPVRLDITLASRDAVAAPVAAFAAPFAAATGTNGAIHVGASIPMRAPAPVPELPSRSRLNV